MILMSFLNLIFSVLKALFSWFTIPDLPVFLMDILDEAMNLVKMGVGLLYCFVHKEVVISSIIFALFIHEFEHIYDLTMWVLAKIPIGIRKN